MPQGDEEASEVKEALKDGEDAVVAHLDAAEVLQPCVSTFDFPAFAVAAQLAFVFEAAVAAVLTEQILSPVPPQLQWIDQSYRARHYTPVPPELSALLSRPVLV